MVEVCLPVRRADSWVIHMYMQTHLPNHLWCDPSFFEMFVWGWTAQKGWTNIQTSQMALWLQFLGCPRSGQEFGDNPWQDQFLKKLYNPVDHWKGLECLVKDTYLGLSPNLNVGNRHKAATIHLFWVPCAKEKPMVILICTQCQRILTFWTPPWRFAIFPDRGSGILQKREGGYRCGCVLDPMVICQLHIPGALEGKFLQ